MRIGQRLAGWVEAERGRFLLWLPVAFGAAIVGYFALPVEPPLRAGIIAACACLAVTAASWHWPVPRYLALLALAAALGFLRAELRTASLPPPLHVPYGVVGIAGRVTALDILPTGQRITIGRPSIDDAAPLARAVRLKLRANESTAVQVGDRVALRGMLFQADRPAYPGGWDPARDAFFARLGASGFAVSPITVTQPASGDGGLGIRIGQLRQAIGASILRTLPLPTGAVAVTLLTGTEQVIPPDERQRFISAGLAHLLAVAGLHVGIVMGVAFFVARFLLTRSEFLILRLDGKAVAAVASLAAGAGYAVLTGAHLPILRSLAMASLVTVGVLAGRRAISLRGLALAAAAILVVTPEAVLSVSFQMSFSAVLALIAGYAALPRGTFRSTGWRRLALGLAATGYTSLLAGGASMPYAAYQFLQVQPYWILANLVAVPLMAFWIMPLGLVALILMPLGAGILALVPMGWGIWLILWMIGHVASWPGAMLRIPPVPDIAVLVLTPGLLWLCLWRSPARFAGVPLIALGIVLGVFPGRPPDVLVSPDARLIALRLNGQVDIIRQRRASNFTLAQWQPLWRTPLVTLPPDGDCAAAACTVPFPAGDLLVTPQAPDGTCPAAILVISAEPLRGACSRPGSTVIDRFTVWRNGAVAAWVGPHGIRVATDRAAQGSRPWDAPWPASWRATGD